MRKPGIFPPAELCCSVVAARRPTDLPTLFLKVGIAVSLRVFYTTGFIFQSYEIKCNYRHFRPDLWLFADVILWVKGKFAAACRGGSYFGETGSFVADGLKNPGFSEGRIWSANRLPPVWFNVRVQPDWRSVCVPVSGMVLSGVTTSGRRRSLRACMASEISSRR